jgi:ankyrin repeat protein
MYAVRQGNISAVAWLIKEGANASARDNEGNDILYYAASANKAVLSLVQRARTKQ